MDDAGEGVIVPAPALAEALVAADDIAGTLAKLQQYARIQIKPFGNKAAIEYAARVRAAIERGDKKDGSEADWKTVTKDRQIVTIAAVEGATDIYSTDRDIHRHAEIFGLRACHLNDIVLPVEQTRMDLGGGDASPDDESAEAEAKEEG